MALDHALSRLARRGSGAGPGQVDRQQEGGRGRQGRQSGIQVSWSSTSWCKRQPRCSSTAVCFVLYYSESALEVGSPYTLSLEVPRLSAQVPSAASGSLLLGLCASDPVTRTGLLDDLDGEHVQEGRRRKNLWIEPVTDQYLRPGNNRWGAGYYGQFLLRSTGS